jgi:cytochrome c-type biogenesis protein CcmF
VALGSLLPLRKRGLRRTPLFTWGMVIAHLGVRGVARRHGGESAFTKSRSWWRCNRARR